MKFSPTDPGRNSPGFRIKVADAEVVRGSGRRLANNSCFFVSNSAIFDVCFRCFFP